MFKKELKNPWIPVGCWGDWDWGGEGVVGEGGRVRPGGEGARLGELVELER